MTVKSGGGFCPYCKKHVLTQKNTLNHILHLLLSVFTGGLWLVVWLLLIMRHTDDTRCVECGRKI